MIILLPQLFYVIHNKSYTVYMCSSIDSRGHMYAYSLPCGQDFFPIQMGKPVGYKRKNSFLM